MGEVIAASADRPAGGRADTGRVRPDSARWAGGVGGASGGGKAEGKPTPRARLTGYAGPAFPQLKGSVAGTGFEPV